MYGLFLLISDSLRLLMVKSAFWNLFSKMNRASARLERGRLTKLLATEIHLTSEDLCNLEALILERQIGHDVSDNALIPLLDEVLGLRNVRILLDVPGRRRSARLAKKWKFISRKVNHFSKTLSLVQDLTFPSHSPTPHIAILCRFRTRFRFPCSFLFKSSKEMLYKKRCWSRSA